LDDGDGEVKVKAA
jgi:hypothetical protein